MTYETTKSKQGQGKRRISVEFYEAMLQAFRETPGNLTAAAKAVGCDRSTSTRGWKLGWPKYDWARPICEVLAEEQGMARSKMAEAIETMPANEERGHSSDRTHQHRETYINAQREREQARVNAVNTRADLGKMLTGLRELTIQCEAIIGERSPGVTALASRLNEEMREMARAPQGTFDMFKAQRLLRLHVADVRNVSVAASRVYELEQTHLGEPSKFIGIQPTHFDDADEAALVREIRKALEAIEESTGDGTPRSDTEAERFRH